MRIGYLFGASLQTELIIFSIIGIVYTIFDASLLEVNSNLNKIWDLQMDPKKFSPDVTLYVKYILSVIVLVRSFTVHIYLGCYVVMLYPIFFEDRPGLLIPWITINIIKNILTSLAAFVAGCYICILYRFVPPSCWEFLLTHYLETAPSVYMLCLVFSYHKHLKGVMRIRKYIHPLELRARRHRVRMNPENKVESRSRQNFSRSLDGLLEKIKEDDETEMHPTFERKVSFAQMNSYADSFASSSYQDQETETPKLETSAVYTQSFQISGNVISILPDETSSRPHGIDLEHTDKRIDQLEELERISDLDGSFKLQVSSTKEQSQATTPKSLSVPLTKQEIKQEKEIVSKTPKGPEVVIGNHTFNEFTRTPMQDATMQYEVNDTTEDTTQINISVKRKSTLTEPSMVKKANSPLIPQMEGAKPATPKATTPVKEIYKNRTAYPKTYRDDGYTQAYFEKYEREKQLAAEKKRS